MPTSILYDNMHTRLLTIEGVGLIHKIVTKLLKSRSISRLKQAMSKNKIRLKRIME